MFLSAIGTHFVHLQPLQLLYTDEARGRAAAMPGHVSSRADIFCLIALADNVASQQDVITAAAPCSCTAVSTWPSAAVLQQGRGTLSVLQHSARAGLPPSRFT